MVAKKKTRGWTQAGAARAAREARIATIDFLAHAPIARGWHLNRLVSAYQVHETHTGSRDAAAALLFGGMGYRPPYPRTWAETVEMVLTDEARHLTEADLYVLSPQMCDVVVAAAESLTIEDLRLVDPDDLPSPTGLVVLPHPLVTTAVGGELSDLRAFAWRTPAAHILPVRHGGGLQEDPAVRMSSFHDTHGPVRPDSFLEFAALARARGTPLPPLLLDAGRCLPFRSGRESSPEALDRFVAAARQTVARHRQLRQAQGFDEDRVVGEYTPGGALVDADDSLMPRFLYAFWRLCEQRIAEMDVAEVNHSAQVLADRAGVSPQVRVVRLRRIDQPRAGHGQGRDWQHRWVVRMHRVRQWYPSEQRHKVIYRGPYLKGPDDKPLIGGTTTVRSLVR
ncbi:hypothetical protein AB1460_24590 [Parafrankia sp. FMc2]